MIGPGGTPGDPGILASMADASVAAVAAVTRRQLAERASATFAALTTFGERLRDQRSRLLLQTEELRRQREEMRAHREQLREQGSALRAAGVVLSRRAEARPSFEDAPTCYLVTHWEGTIRRVNRRTAALLDLAPSELEGRPLAELVDRSDREGFQLAFARLLTSPGVEEWPMRLRPRRGAPLDLRSEACTMRDEDGRVMAIHWILHITDDGLGDLL